MSEVTADEVSLDLKTTEPMFFGVSSTKLIVMSLFTFGLYNFYWFYKNFLHYENRYNEGTIPFLRALFSPIFSYSLFTTINCELENSENSKSLPAGVLAAFYFLLNLSGRVFPSPFFLLSFLVFVPLLAANQRINDLNSIESNAYTPDSKFTWINWIFLAIGGALTLLMILGLVVG